MPYDLVAEYSTDTEPLYCGDDEAAVMRYLQQYHG